MFGGGLKLVRAHWEGPPPLLAWIEQNEGRKYKWKQTAASLTVMFVLPTGLRGRDLNVDLTKKKIKVAVKKNNNVLLEGELADEVKPDDSTWEIEDGNLTITLKKMNLVIYQSGQYAECFWKRVFVDEQERSFNELGDADYTDLPEDIQEEEKHRRRQLEEENIKEREQKKTKQQTN